MRLRALTSAFALTAVLLAGCGDRSALVPGDDASRIQADLDSLQSFVSSGDCTQATEALRQLTNDAARLPVTVDRRLRERIREGVQALAAQAPAACADARTEQQQTETQTTDTQTTTAPDTETTPGTETTTETTPTTDTTTTPTQTQTTTTQTTTTQTVPPTEGTGGAPGDPGATP